MNAPQRWIIAALAVATAVLVSGCWTLSVNPLYTPRDVMYDAGLVGVWGDPEDPTGETWEFQRGEGSSYRLIIRERGGQLLVDPRRDGVFEVYLFTLGKERYLDFFPEEPDSVSTFYKCHVIPAHSFAKVSLGGDALGLSFLDPEWLKNKSDEGSLELRHERRDDLIVLTASTEDLRKFVLAHADEAFDTPEIAKRLR